MKGLVWAALTVLALILTNAPALAAETEATEDFTEYMDMLDFDSVSRAIAESGGDASTSFRGLVEQAIKGELDLSPAGLINRFLSALFSEIFTSGALMRNLLMICVLSALLKTLTDSFENKAVGELGFYVCYIVLVVVLFTAFETALTLTKGVVSTLSGIMAAGVPLFISLMVMSGAAGSGFMFSPTLAFATNAVSALVAGFIAPLAVLGAAIEIVNYITEKRILTNFAGLIKNVCAWSLGGAAAGFVALLSVQKLSAPILNTAAAKAARVAANAVPVVGGMLGGAWDMALVWAQTARSGVLAAFIIAVVTACAFPAIKLLALILIFKVAAALVQPVCDERIVKCMDAVSSFSLLLLGCLVTVAIMFVMFAVVLLSF